jgi:hypothetical protein
MKAEQTFSLYFDSTKTIELTTAEAEHLTGSRRFGSIEASPDPDSNPSGIGVIAMT